MVEVISVSAFTYHIVNIKHVFFNVYYPDPMTFTYHIVNIKPVNLSIIIEGNPLLYIPHS